MIIFDMNQMTIAAFMSLREQSTDVDLIRHVILNSILKIKKKFSNEFGDNIVIAYDGKEYWRKDIFPYYKANRKRDRDKSSINWKDLFNSMDIVRTELKEVFPYRVIHINEVEADDIIASLVMINANSNEKILIISSDKDFIQLQTFMNVKQYNSMKGEFVTHNNPERYLMEHIIRGDSGDGVPNILSEDNTLVIGKRQKSIFQKNLDDWLGKSPEEFCDDFMLRNFNRNKKLIDLSLIPDEHKQTIYNEYEKQAGKTKKELFNYFIKNRLKLLIEDINDF